MKPHSRFKGAKPFSHHQTNTTKTLENIFKSALVSGRLNLSSKGLVELPLEKFLDVASGGVEGVQFWEVVDLRVLDISHNNVTNVPDCCGGLQSVEVLNAQYNPLSEWPTPFCELRSLRSLDCSHCNIVAIPPHIDNLGETLISLSLINNRLSNIDSLLQGLPLLQILKLSKNQIQSLPSDLSWPEQLKHIELSENQLREIHSNMCMLKELDTLDLSKNQIQRLPSSICELRKLSSFNIRQNDLSGVIEYLPESKFLHTVLLGRNKVSELRVSFTTCPNLNVLDLSENKLTQLPEDICCLGYLKTLDVTNNDLSSLPHGLGYIMSLSRMAVDGNKLRTIRRQLLNSCEQLKKYLRTRGDSPEILDPECSFNENNGVSKVGAQGDKSLEMNIIQRTRQIGSTGVLQLTGVLLDGSFLGSRTRSSDEIFRVLTTNENVVHTLDLGNNQLNTLPLTLLQACINSRNIHTLSVKNNCLTVLPEELNYIPLIHLNVSFNRSLTENGIGQNLPSSLLHLDISNIGISSVPSIIFQKLWNLETLILDGNSFGMDDVSRYPWSSLQKIRELGLSGCCMKTMPPDLHVLPLLETIDLSNNNISYVPPTISLSKSIKVLRLSGNSLKSIRYDIIRAGTDSILTYLGKKLPEEQQRDVNSAMECRRYGNKGKNTGNTGGEGGMSRQKQLDEEIDELKQIIETSNFSKVKIYAMEKKLKLLKAKRIRMVREAQKKK